MSRLMTLILACFSAPADPAATAERRQINARLTESDGTGRYGFVEVRATPDHEWVPREGGIVGTLEDGPACELNQDVGLPVPLIVSLIREPRTGCWWFQCSSEAC